MKVGEAGEAFFVFETDDDIPDDLITSPLLEATQTAAETHADVPTGEFGAKRGEGESIDVDHIMLPEEAAQEPEYLDLDAESKDQPSYVPPTQSSKLQQFTEAISSLPSSPPSPNISGITPSSLLAAVGTKLDRKVNQSMQGEGHAPDVSYNPGKITTSLHPLILRRARITFLYS